MSIQVVLSLPKWRWLKLPYTNRLAARRATIPLIITMIVALLSTTSEHGGR